MKNSRRTITKGARKMEVHVAVRYDIGSPHCYLGRGGGSQGVDESIVAIFLALHKWNTTIFYEVHLKR